MCEWCQWMIVDPFGAEKMPDLPAAYDESIRNNPAMAFLG